MVDTRDIRWRRVYKCRLPLVLTDAAHYILLPKTSFAAIVTMHFAIVISLASAAGALTHAVDSSAAITVATYKKALGEGFTKAIPRGFSEACDSGGLVDANFVSSYKNAVAAGYKDFDTYMYPCTGTAHKCKPYAQQVKLLTDAIAADKMNIGTIWLDIEKDKTCNPWDYGAAGNLAEAKKLVAALKGSGHKWGIYSTPGVWAEVFGSRSVVLDNTAPLWFAVFDHKETLDLTQPFGGWTKAIGHQYVDAKGSASGKFDLSVFA